MLKYVNSNLFDSPAQTLVNTVNLVGVMGKGIAAEFKRRYPDMFRRYAEHCKNGSLDIGKLYLYRTANKFVLNFPTKKHWRNPSKLEYIEAGLKKFADTYAAHGIVSISFPQLGCGNGGLSWNEVQPLMDKYLRDLPIPVYIHVASSGKDFVPEHVPTKTENNAASYLNANRARRGVAFEEVWRRLWAEAGMSGDSELVGSTSADGFLPEIRVNSEGRVVHLPGEDIEALWTSLRMRGALPQNEFPGALRLEAAVVRELLLKLDFLRPIQFVVEQAGTFRQEPGVRFAPDADMSLPEIAVPEYVE
ncbi:MAG: macro domain-containing protein [Polyangiaceae bacterium]|nr:macro domain-containing protein [Polyangiaceae bacterium]